MILKLLTNLLSSTNDITCTTTTSYSCTVDYPAIDIVKELDSKFKVRLTFHLMREYIVDEDRSIIWDKVNNKFLLFFIGSPLPYPCGEDVVLSLLEEK